MWLLQDQATREILKKLFSADQPISELSKITNTPPLKTRRKAQALLKKGEERLLIQED